MFGKLSFDTSGMLLTTPLERTFTVGITSFGSAWLFSGTRTIIRVAVGGREPSVGWGLGRAQACEGKTRRQLKRLERPGPGVNCFLSELGQLGPGKSEPAPEASSFFISCEISHREHISENALYEASFIC